MRRYLNWSLVALGAILAATATTASWWIPVIQPYIIEEVTTEEFTCLGYVSEAQCAVLEEMYQQNSDHAVLLMRAMNPENDFEVIDPEIVQVANELRESIGSSDQPEPSVIRNGVFDPPTDAIHNARGEAKIIQLVALDRNVTKYLVRLESGSQGMFEVTNGPDLRIYLSRHPDPTNSAELFSGAGGALEVGRLKGNRGRQNYDLSVDFDPTPYQSLVIYSPELDQIFGVAPFIIE